MMTPLVRIRIELDRTVRAREFVARAIRGTLGAEEYADFVGELASLLVAGASERASDLVFAAWRDLEALGARSKPVRRSRCTCADMLAGAVRNGAAPPEAALDVVISVIATSWLRDCAARSARRWPGASSLLRAMATRSRRSPADLEARLERGTLDLEGVYALAELARGAFLGLTTCLDLRWPAPFATLGLPVKE